MSTALAYLLFAYMVLCSFLVPMGWLEEQRSERECAKKHQVFTCEQRIEWKPVEAQP